MAVDVSSRPDAVVAAGPCSPPVSVDRPFALLSQTGCFDSKVSTKMAAVVTPYEVNSPLWSDLALKTRGFVIPNGKKIHVKDCAKNPTECCVSDPNNSSQCLPPADDGQWVFPVGTVLVKNFLFNDDPKDLTTGKAKLVETRLFIRFSEKLWAGYSYRWDEAQTDATLVPADRVSAMFNTGKRIVPWNYPSRTDCIKCHTVEGGSSIGPETKQMNRVVDGMNQIDRWAARDLFELPPSKPYRAALTAPFAGQSGAPATSATIDERVRSYLHANCAYCHRPDGNFYFFDLRYGVSLADTHLCNQVPNKGDQGVAGATNLSAGDPNHSILYLRMKALGGNPNRMPQIGTDVVDLDATKLISEWINGLKTCP